MNFTKGNRMNNKWFRVLLFLFFLTTVACAPSATSAPISKPAAPASLASAPATTAPIVITAPTVSASPDFDPKRAMEHNRMLAVTIGKRDAATEGGIRAVGTVINSRPR